MAKITSIFGISSLKVANAFPTLEKPQIFNDFAVTIPKSKKNWAGAKFLKKPKIHGENKHG